MLKFISKLKSNKLFKSDFSVVAVMFIALLFATMIPAGIFNSGERDVYGYGSSSRGRSVAFRITEEDKSDLQERLEDIREKTEELAEIVAKQQEPTTTVVFPAPTTKEGYIKEYIAYGANNNAEEVRKLQIFLNKHMGESIPVTGFYGDITLNAVKRFQEKYADEILRPWGIAEATGYVYKTTQRMINVIETGQDIPMPFVAQAPVVVPVTPTTPTQERSRDIVGERRDVEQEEITWGIPEEDDAQEEIEDGEIIVIGGTDEEKEEETEEKEEKRRVIEWVLIAIGTIGIFVVVFTIRNFKTPGGNLSL